MKEEIKERKSSEEINISGNDAETVEKRQKRGYANSTGKICKTMIDKYQLKIGENLFIESLGDSSE